MRVSLSNPDLSFSVNEQEPILRAALRSGLTVPYGCRGGHCGACRARLLHGAVHYPRGAPLGLSPADAAEGFILLCQACAESDLCIDAVRMRPAGAAVIKRLPARIERVEHLTHDVLGLGLRLPAAEDFTFEPGHHVDILCARGTRRSFSIASPPHDSPLLELHVRRVAGGEFTAPLFDQDPRGKLLWLEGPLGRFNLEGASVRPLLLIGGGTGIAPLLCMVRHLRENGAPRAITLYWGARQRRDLYLDERLGRWARQAEGLFRYIPVLSSGEADWMGPRGWVHEAVLGAALPMAECDIYASGPPAMIAAIRASFPRHGADPEHLWLESFDDAQGAAERQRNSAATKA